MLSIPLTPGSDVSSGYPTARFLVVGGRRCAVPGPDGPGLWRTDVRRLIPMSGRRRIHQLFQLRTRHANGILRLQPFGDCLGPLREAPIVQDAAHRLAHRRIIARLAPDDRRGAQGLGTRRHPRLVPAPWHQHHRHTVVKRLHNNPMPGVADNQPALHQYRAVRNIGCPGAHGPAPGPTLPHAPARE